MAQDRHWNSATLIHLSEPDGFTIGLSPPLKSLLVCLYPFLSLYDTCASPLTPHTCKHHKHDTYLTRGSNGDSVYTGELLRGAHFDDDVPATLQAQVAGRAGRSHIEGNPMVLCCDGQLVCAHFVGCVAIGNHSICTYHYSCEGEYRGKGE